jgi:hypothetical protein
MVDPLNQQQSGSHAAADGNEAGQRVAGELPAADADDQADLEQEVGARARVTAITASPWETNSRLNRRRVDSTLASASVRPEAMATM